MSAQASGSSLEGCPHEAYLSAQPNSPQARPWLPCSDEDPGREGCSEAAPSQGPQTHRCRDSLQVGVGEQTGRFGRADRIRFPRQYRRVSQQGRRSASSSVVLLVADGGQGCRLGITVSRKVGNAVARNRIKRRIRDWFRRTRSGLRQDLDVVVIAKPGACALSTQELGAELERLAREAGALQCA